MKNAKKVLSLVLALIMCFSCFAISGSAFTQQKAQEYADKYNAEERNFSAIMGNVSIEKATKNADKMNSLLKTLFEKINLKGMIFSDSVVTTIAKTVGGLLNPNISKCINMEALKESHPDAYAYLSTVKGDLWENIDASKVTWGVTAGDRASFEQALISATNGENGLLKTLYMFVGHPYLFFVNPKPYTEGLAPLLEQLHVGKMPSEAELKADPTQLNAAKAMLNIVLNAIEAFIANPVNYITDVLPGFATLYDGISARYIPDPTKASDGLAVALNKVFPNVEGMKDLTAPYFKDLVPMIGKLVGLTLPEVDYEQLKLMGTASVVDTQSGKTPNDKFVDIAGNKPVVYMALVGFIKKTLDNKDNVAAIGRIVVDKAGIVSTEDYDRFIAATKTNNEDEMISELVIFIGEVVGNLGGNKKVNPLIRAFSQFVMAVTRFYKYFKDIILKLVHR